MSLDFAANALDHLTYFVYLEAVDRVEAHYIRVLVVLPYPPRHVGFEHLPSDVPLHYSVRELVKHAQHLCGSHFLPLFLLAEGCNFSSQLLVGLTFSIKKSFMSKVLFQVFTKVLAML